MCPDNLKRVWMIRKVFATKILLSGKFSLFVTLKWRNAVGGQENCNGKYCCSLEIFNQLKALPCVDHNGCRTLGYGNFCCPAKENISESSTCCDDYPSWIRLLYHDDKFKKWSKTPNTIFLLDTSIWFDVIHYHPFSKSESEITETCLFLLFCVIFQMSPHHMVSIQT